MQNTRPGLGSCQSHDCVQVRCVARSGDAPPGQKAAQPAERHPTHTSCHTRLPHLLMLPSFPPGLTGKKLCFWSSSRGVPSRLAFNTSKIGVTPRHSKLAAPAASGETKHGRGLIKTCLAVTCRSCMRSLMCPFRGLRTLMAVGICGCPRASVASPVPLLWRPAHSASKQELQRQSRGEQLSLCPAPLCRSDWSSGTRREQAPPSQRRSRGYQQHALAAASAAVAQQPAASATAVTSCCCAVP